MSNHLDVEEKKRLYKYEVIKFLEKFWNIKSNSLPEGMPQKMIYDTRFITKLLNILLDKEENKKEKTNKKKIKRLKKSFSTQKMDPISEHAKTIINKIGRNIKKIKSSITDITKMNGLYVEQSARTTFNTTRLMSKKKNFDKLNLKNEFLLDNIIKKENDINNKKKYNMTFRQNINKKMKNITIFDKEQTKKDDYIKNFLFVNDNYRKQLNLAFLKFNANKHLNNIKTLVQIDPIIRKDIVKINDEINEDIKLRCDKAHFRKKYERIKKTFARSNSVQNTPKMAFNNNQNFLPNLTKRNTKKYIVFEPKTSKKSINIFEKIKKDDKHKFTFSKDDKIEEMKYMLQASSEINNLLKNDIINKKIDLYKTNFEKNLKLNELYNINSDDLIKKNYFKVEIKNIVDKLGDIYELKIRKNEEEKENKIKAKIYNEHDNLNKKFIEDKMDAIDEINNLINDNKSVFNTSKISKD